MNQLRASIVKSYSTMRSIFISCIIRNHPTLNFSKTNSLIFQLQLFIFCFFLLSNSLFISSSQIGAHYIVMITWMRANNGGWWLLAGWLLSHLLLALLRSRYYRPTIISNTLFMARIIFTKWTAKIMAKQAKPFVRFVVENGVIIIIIAMIVSVIITKRW